FMPPEQRKDVALTDSRSDLWALAATLYQMVTGKSPKIIRFNNVPQSLQDVLGKALEDEKDDRYQTAAEFRDALRGTLADTASPVVAPAAELGAGECRNCHTRNEANRKFCQGCGSSLRFSCLSCDEQIPVWDNFCSECGGKQSELAASKLEEFASQRDQAEDHRREYRFEDALSIARSLASVEDERIAEHVKWATEFVTATESHWERERESAVANFEEARTHRDAFDYASAIHAVESVPEAMRTSEMSDYLQQLESDRAESEDLITTISERVQRRDLQGLLEQVERAVELRGDRADLQKLQGQLRERKAKQQKQQKQREEACAEATRLFGTGDAKGALTMIQSVPSEDLRSSDETLRSELEKIVAAEDELTALVKDAKADGVLDPDEVAAMWQAAHSYLGLNPRHAKIAAMQRQLEARIQKAPAKYASFGELAGFWAAQPTAVLTPIIRNLPLSSNTLGMEFKPIIGGTFTMGDKDDAPAHRVTLTKAFELGVYGVTQKQYEQVMGTNPSEYKGAQNPVDTVSWHEAVEFCRKLSALPAEQAAGRVYRLPTEA
ncbi:MAG: SUMF1/EgtB/PvdO family nonheme iron enzyme, partial [Fuerstiella sp.]